MSMIRIFSEATLGTVRTLIMNGEPYFVGADVTDILGYKNSRDTLAKRVDAEDKGVAKCDTLGGDQEMTVINESGLYSLIITSKKPEAKRFKHWITSDVLPSIRKHGMYATPETVEDILDNPDNMIKILTAYRDERKANEALKQEVAVRDQQLLEMQPKVSYYDIVLQCEDLLRITSIAKDYGWSAERMNKELHEKGIQYKTPDGQWLLYQKYAGQGYTATKTHVFTGSSGIERSKIHTYWTQKGRLFIYDLLKKDGILPEIEKEAIA